METLFTDAEVFQKERPTKPTDQQLKDFYQWMAKELIKEGFSDDDEDEIARDLKGLYPFRNNGFQLAKEIERDGRASYEIDVSFCEWLEGLESEYRQLNTENVKAWVKAHNPQPKLEKGAKLIVNEFLCSGKSKGLEVYVNGGDPEIAAYYINKDPNAYGGTVLAYELVEKCCSIIENSK